MSIEKVKMVDSSSIRHLAAHSNLVRDILPNGEIIPSKLLSSFKMEDYGVYENRFLKTLINRLHRYVNIRYNSIQKNYESYLRRELEVNSDFTYQNEEVKIALSLSGKRNMDYMASGERFDVIMARLARIKLIVNGLKYSQFMRMMTHEREVLPPVVRTNAISKNIDLIAAYNLWTFIDRETNLKFDIDHRSSKLDINSAFQNDLVVLLSDLYKKYLFYSDSSRINKEARAFLKTKKATIVRGYSGKFVISDEQIRVENTQLSEYYLQQITGQLSEKYRDFVVNGRGKKEAAIRILKDVLKVADVIYENIDFDQTPNSKDEELRMKYLQEQERYLSAFVAAKQMSMNKQVRELKTVIRQRKAIEKKQKDRIKKQKEKEARLKAKEQKRKEKELALKAAKLAKLKELKEQEKARELAMKKAAQEKIRAQKAKERAEALEKVRLEKLAKDAQKAKEKAAIAEKKRLEQEKLKIEKAKEKAKQDEQKRKEKERLAIQKAKEQEKLKAIKEKERLLQLETKKKEKELSKSKSDSMGTTTKKKPTAKLKMTNETNQMNISDIDHSTESLSNQVNSDRGES